MLVLGSWPWGPRQKQYPSARKLPKPQKTPCGPGTEDTKLKLIYSFLHVFIQLISMENQLRNCLCVTPWGTSSGLVTAALREPVGGGGRGINNNND